MARHGGEESKESVLVRRNSMCKSHEARKKKVICLKNPRKASMAKAESKGEGVTR